ncbi:MAG: winged helix-turn-helix transcriptional regulator [Deltaproteobacteria bacterium]|nr:winged helix-turn-helix transcriptional regulator [Deltaproteobacteria bacterium]
MDHRDLRTLKLLEEIEHNHAPSQRDLAKKLNISLGLVNAFVKRLAHKGYFKISTIPKNRVMYILTPKGMAEKTRLTKGNPDETGRRRRRQRHFLRRRGTGGNRVHLLTGNQHPADRRTRRSAGRGQLFGTYPRRSGRHPEIRVRQGDHHGHGDDLQKVESASFARYSAAKDRSP